MVFYFRLNALITWRIVRVYTHNELAFAILHPFRKMRQTKLVRIMKDFNRKAIAERSKLLKEELEREGSEGRNDNMEMDMPAKKRRVFLDILLMARHDGQTLTDDDISCEVDSFMLGGTDTTSRTVSFTLHLLARHPKIQQQVVDEIYQVYGENNAVTFTLSNLNELTYLTCVIKEALRMYPPIPLIGRKLIEDFKYSMFTFLCTNVILQIFIISIFTFTLAHSRFGDGIIPKDTQVIISLYNSLRDPAVFERPNEFLPERHLEADKFSPYAFVPFSAGPRNCLGQKFAIYEIKVILTRILLSYEMLPLGPDVKPTVGLVMDSENGVHLGMKKRITSP